MAATSIALFIVVPCLLFGAAQAQDSSQTRAQDIVPVAAHPYLAPLLAAERASAPVLALAPGSARTHAAMALRHEVENLATQRAFVGDVDGALAAFDMLSDTVSAAPPLAPDLAAEDAIAAIVEQARDKRIVFINEAHHVPLHRAFTARLVAALGKIGYRYLACEAFALDGAGVGTAGVRIAAPRRASVASGYYVGEPVFAGMVDTALASGWTLVPYEDETPPAAGAARTIDQRERTQADNLVARIFARDPHARVLVHVGYGHLYKSSARDPDMPVMMAEYLRRLTGLATLHVDQTIWYAHHAPTSDAPLYAALVARFPLQQPFVLRAPDGSHPVLLGMDGHVDMQVVFPRYGSHGGRADWLRTLARRHARTVPAALLPRSGRRLVKAYQRGAGADAVPSDMVLLEAGKPAPLLMLPPGQFRYMLEDAP